MSSDDLKRMEEEITSQSAGLRASGEALINQALEAVTPDVASRTERIHLVGCGDSFQAGLASQLAFAQWTGLPAQAHLALEFSEYVVPLLGKSDVVIPISNSGKVARTIEAAVRAKSKGATVLAITGDISTALASEADAIIGTKAATSVGVTPGTHSFTASMLASWSIASALATRLDREAPPFLDVLERQLPLVTAVEVVAPNEWLEAILTEGPLQMMGAGGAWALALYAQMKFLESAAVPSMPFELEEWAHSGYFLTRRGTPLLLLATPGQSFARAQEVFPAAIAMGGRVLVIGHEGVEWPNAAGVIEIPGDMEEALWPALLAVPIQRLSLALAQRMETTPLGFDDPQRKAVNFQQIFESEIRCDPPTW